MVIKIVEIIISPLIAFVIGVFFLGLSRKIMARIHWRYGPPLTQPVIDIIKLFNQTSISHGGIFNMGSSVKTEESPTTSAEPLPERTPVISSLCRPWTCESISPWSVAPNRALQLGSIRPRKSKNRKEQGQGKGYG